MRFFSYVFFLITTCFFTGSFVSAVAQQVPNRFQYHTFKWQTLPAGAVQIYFPKGYDSLAAFVTRHLPAVIGEVEERMGRFSLQAAPNIILYPAVDQLYESNIGLTESGIKRFPTFSLPGNRMLLAFNGSYEALHQQLSRAYAAMVWENLFQRELEDQATGGRQLIPDWFREGAIRYFGEGWPFSREQALALLFNAQQPADWSQLIREDPDLAGQAFCYFLDLQYRKNASKDVLFQLRSGKSLARAVRLVTKRDEATLTSACFDFYSQRFAHLQTLPGDTITRQLRERYPAEALIQYLLSPDGKHLVYVMEKAGRRTVYVQPLPVGAGKRRTLSRYLLPPWIGPGVPDVYPLPAWSDDSRQLWVAAPYKGHIRVRQYSLQGEPGPFRTLYGIDGIESLLLPDRNQWLLAAFRRGQGDIVAYHPGRLRFTPLTNDRADQYSLSYLDADGLKRIAYRSGFPADRTFPTDSTLSSDSTFSADSTAKAYGIYLKVLPSNGTEASTVGDRLLLADTAALQWQEPELLDAEKLLVSGAGLRDTISLRPDARQDLQSFLSGTPFLAWVREYHQQSQARDSLQQLLRKLRERDKEPSALQGIFQAAGIGQPSTSDSNQNGVYRPEAIRPYTLQLYSSYFSLQVNNDYFINRYQPFQAYLGSFKFPEVGVMAQGGVSDLFENHHAQAGYRMPTATAGSDFFLRYKNTGRKLDWHIQFFRKVESLSPDPLRDWKAPDGRQYPNAAKVKTHYYELGFHYPIRYDLSLDYLVAARKDRTIFLATSDYSLRFEDLRQWWTIHSLSLSRNRLRPQPGMLLMYRGWQARLLADGMLALERPSTILGGVQGMLEYHQPLFKDLNLVARGQAGISGGQSHILYNFGGVDNNVTLRTDTAIRFSQQAPYAFLSLITPFRGYAQNSLYGSSFGLLNLDLYLPLFTSLIPLNTSFTALNQLQLGLFSDIAAAREPEGPIRSLASWGFSARTLLAGYPVRVEVAWPGDWNQQPVWYLSLRL